MDIKSHSPASMGGYDGRRSSFIGLPTSSRNRELINLPKILVAWAARVWIEPFCGDRQKPPKSDKIDLCRVTIITMFLW